MVFLLFCTFWKDNVLVLGSYFNGDLIPVLSIYLIGILSPGDIIPFSNGDWKLCIVRGRQLWKESTESDIKFFSLFIPLANKLAIFEKISQIFTFFTASLDRYILIGKKKINCQGQTGSFIINFSLKKMF